MAAARSKALTSRVPLAAANLEAHVPIELLHRCLFIATEIGVHPKYTLKEYIKPSSIEKLIV